MTELSNVAITTDSTCDLPKQFIEENNITVFPLTILLGEKEFRDGVDICPDDIYSYVDKTGTLPRTAAVAPSVYAKTFKSFVDQGKKVVHIGFSSALSSTFQNACVASAELDGVYCIDSKNLCTAMGLLVLKACDFRAEGMPAEKIADMIKSLIPKVSATFVIDSLKFLHKGGRCSSVAKLGANVLGIKPTIAVDNQEGTLDVAKKYRGKMDAVYKKYVSDRIEDVACIDTDRIVVANSGGIDDEVLDYAESIIKSKADFGQIIRADAGCTISSHCGPKTLAVFYLKK